MGARFLDGIIWGLGFGIGLTICALILGALHMHLPI